MKTAVFSIVRKAPVLSALFFLILGACSHHDDHDHDHNHDHAEAEGILLINGAGDTVLNIFEGQGVDTLFLELSASAPHYDIYFLDHDEDAFQPDEDGYLLGWNIADTALVTLDLHPGESWAFHLEPKAVGSTTLRLEILHGSHADFTTPTIPIVIQ